MAFVRIALGHHAHGMGKQAAAMTVLMKPPTRQAQHDEDQHGGIKPVPDFCP